MPARVAVYYAPACADPLWQAAAEWLGRDPEANAPVAQPALPGIAAITQDARRYGFHATLKPPFRLRAEATWAALEAAAAQLAGRLTPFDLPRLAVADPHGFLALRETASCPELQALADECIAGLDDFREPPDADELAKRRHGGLSAAEDAMLVRWGYPYAFETWFFHMTITRRLAEEEHARLRPAAEAHFATALVAPRRVYDLCLFTQPDADAPFVLAARLPFGG